MKISLVAAAIIFLPVAAFCQEFRGAISGAVVDPTGAAIPNVSVTALEIRTGTRSQTVSDSGGQYTIPFLAPGQYEVSVKTPGFKEFVRKGVQLASSDHPVI